MSGGRTAGEETGNDEGDRDMLSTRPEQGAWEGAEGAG